MKTTFVRELRNQVSSLIQGKETVLVTRRGKPAAVLIPLSDPNKVPMEIRRELFFDFSQQMARALKAYGVTEEDVLMTSPGSRSVAVLEEFRERLDESVAA